jgi:hypothetical protein
MKYLLSIYGTERAAESVTPEDGMRMLQAYGVFSEELQASGAYIAGEGLEGTNTATTVRVRDGERVVTDGPFAETKEALGGFYLIDAPDLDTALAVARTCPARFGGVEVRPVMTFD